MGNDNGKLQMPGMTSRVVVWVLTIEGNGNESRANEVGRSGRNLPYVMPNCGSPGPSLGQAGSRRHPPRLLLFAVLGCASHLTSSDPPRPSNNSTQAPRPQRARSTRPTILPLPSPSFEFPTGYTKQHILGQPSTRFQPPRTQQPQAPKLRLPLRPSQPRHLREAARLPVDAPRNCNT